MRKQTARIATVNGWTGLQFGKVNDVTVTSFDPDDELEKIGFPEASKLRIATKPGGHDIAVRHLNYDNWIAKRSGRDSQALRICDYFLKRLFGHLPRKLYVTVLVGRKSTKQ